MTSSRSSRSRPHRARRGEGDLLRAELLDAAEALLVEAGSMDAVSMRAVAGSVGVTPPAIYLHFEDKEALFFAACERRFDALQERIEVVLAADHPDVASRLRDLGEVYIDWGLDHAEQYAVLMGGAVPLPAGRDPLSLPGIAGLGDIAAIIAAGTAAGELRPVDPLSATLALWAAAHGYVQLVTDKREFLPPGSDLDEFRRVVLDTAVGGLLA